MAHKRLDGLARGRAPDPNCLVLGARGYERRVV